VAGCRSVYHMLRFSPPQLCEDVLTGIIEEMSVEDLISLTKDELGSRCIMDGILDDHGHTQSSATIFGNATIKLRHKLSGHWASLAMDRVGHHTVKKLFMALPLLDDKATLVEELFTASIRLHENKIGRSVVEACAVDVFADDGINTEWRQTVTSRMVALALALAALTKKREYTGVRSRSTTNTTANNEAYATTIKEGGETTTTKAKRKSSRRKRSTNDTNDIDKSRKKARRESSLGCTMGYIMRYH